MTQTHLLNVNTLTCIVLIEKDNGPQSETKVGPLTYARESTFIFCFCSLCTIMNLQIAILKCQLFKSHTMCYKSFNVQQISPHGKCKTYFSLDCGFKIFKKISVFFFGKIFIVIRFLWVRFVEKFISLLFISYF